MAAQVEDLIVVVPGIQGSELIKDQKPVWALSARAIWQAIRTLAGSVKGLKLPDDLGDDHPGDGIEPGGLMPDLHGLPGLGPFVGGYSDLTRWLGSIGLRQAGPNRPGNLLEFGYDWRLSNRYNARQLQKQAEHALKQWRDDGHHEAKLILYCHSMGGLVARYYLSVLGGAEHTRALVTVGTPHRGSVKALKNLCNGMKLGVGPLSLDLGEIARTFPSAYQLLPTYRCVDTGAGRESLVAAAPASLDRAKLLDAMSFHEEIEKAGDGTPPYRFRMVVGTRQPTFATAAIRNDRVEPLLTIDGNDELGDGTVARFASIPAGVSGADLRQLSSAQRHGWLQQDQGVLDDLHGILTARDIVYMAERIDLPLQPAVELPEILTSSEPLRVRATSSGEALLLRATVAAVDEATQAREAVMTNLGDGAYEAQFDPLPEGVHTVTVAGAPGAGLEPVADAVLVGPASEG